MWFAWDPADNMNLTKIDTLGIDLGITPISMHLTGQDPTTVKPLLAQLKDRDDVTGKVRSESQKAIVAAPSRDAVRALLVMMFGEGNGWPEPRLRIDECSDEAFLQMAKRIGVRFRCSGTQFIPLWEPS